MKDETLKVCVCVCACVRVYGPCARRRSERDAGWLNSHGLRKPNPRLVETARLVLCISPVELSPPSLLSSAPVGGDALTALSRAGWEPKRFLGFKYILPSPRSPLAESAGHPAKRRIWWSRTWCCCGVWGFGPYWCMAAARRSTSGSPSSTSSPTSAPPACVSPTKTPWTYAACSHRVNHRFTRVLCESLFSRAAADC